MRFKVSMKIKDYKFEETIIADNMIDAKRIAKIRNPNTKVLCAYWTYK
tara:strand:+ start:166 stop:309 length:144 start_codon:yes stop_codon:yes gene_type:complete